MDLKPRYVVKGIGKEATIASKIQIFYDKTTGKITKVQDKWDGNLPDSSFTNVSFGQLFSLWWWALYYEGWAELHLGLVLVAGACLPATCERRDRGRVS